MSSYASLGLHYVDCSLTLYWKQLEYPFHRNWFWNIFTLPEHINLHWLMWKCSGLKNIWCLILSLRCKITCWQLINDYWDLLPLFGSRSNYISLLNFYFTTSRACVICTSPFRSLCYCYPWITIYICFVINHSKGPIFLDFWSRMRHDEGNFFSWGIISFSMFSFLSGNNCWNCWSREAERWTWSCIEEGYH